MGATATTVNFAGEGSIHREVVVAAAVGVAAAAASAAPQLWQQTNEQTDRRTLPSHNASLWWQLNSSNLTFHSQVNWKQLQ